MNRAFESEVQDWLQSLQDSICRSLEALDGMNRFHEDNWQRESGGGGRTRVIQNSSPESLFEKGGVNFSAVHGRTPDFLQKEIREAFPGTPETSLQQFLATGVSLVLHPSSPRVPIVHMNVRYFRISEEVRWFGGGIDLTPIYVVEDDARYFHSRLKEVCDGHDLAYYPRFKKWADDYFFIRHREETRGVGGIFFDKLQPGDDKDIASLFRFVQDVGGLFIPAYEEIVRRNRHKPYAASEKEWQLLRRGRYAEFNLVYDRGTRFGLETGGRTESILMSLPPVAEWKYDMQPEENSNEYRTMQFLKKGIDWIS